MDQDSEWKQQTVEDYIVEANQYEHINEVAIFSPYHDAGPYARKGDRSIRFASWRMVMTSGNLLRLSAWQQAHGFRDDFFIDCVDDELDAHLLALGWQIIRCNRIALDHALGNGAHYVPGTKHSYTAHPAWRYYYIARNLQRMAQLYPQRARYYRRRTRKELKRLCFYDWEDKCSKITQLLRGWKEGRMPYPMPFKMVVSPEGESLREWMASIPSRFFVEGKVIYNARNQIRVFTLSDGRQINVKRFHTPAWLNRWVYTFFRQPKAQRAYQNALRLQQMAIPTPKALGYIQCGKHLICESYLITEQEKLSHNFYEFRFHSTEGYEDVIEAFAQLSAHMHQQGVLHLDYSPGNILWDKTPQGEIRFSIVDINRMQFRSKLRQRECCNSFRRLWGHRDFIDLLCRSYAQARHWDITHTQRLIETSWKRFWHIHSEEDIDQVFSLIVQPKK